MSISDKWIKKQINHLNSRVGIYKTNSEFYFEPTDDFYKMISNTDFASINRIIKQITLFVNCNTTPSFGGWRTSSDFVSDNNDINVNSKTSNKEAGLIYSNHLSNNTILIDEKYKNDPQILGAILAHEITHHLLYEKGIVYKDKLENERFTDLATVFFGLGKLLLNGYSSNYNKIGYISYERLAYINIRICDLRNIPINNLKKNLNKRSLKAVNKSKSYNSRKNIILSIKETVKKLIKSIFAPFIKTEKDEVKTPKDSNSTKHIIITCGKCGQKMRLPKKNKKLKIKCPNCNNKTIINPKKDHI